MPQLHPVSLAAAALWAAIVVLALLASSTSAAAGIVTGPWVGAGMALGFLLAGFMGVGAWYLPPTWPRLARRLVLLAGMAGSLWGAGTLTRAVHALLH